MGRTLENITSELAAFIRTQPLFFVATAPLDRGGHVNLSPKGLDTFRVLSPTRVGYLYFTGSGNETAAHIRVNGRIPFMFCAFDGPPKILRLYGRAQVVTPVDPHWDELARHFELRIGARQVVLADIHRVQISCGFSVPRMHFDADRAELDRWAAAKGAEGLRLYRREKNSRSIDGLPTPPLAHD
jgi:hypothetical protein